MPQPEGDKRKEGLIDAVLTSSQKTVKVEQQDGAYTNEQILDEDTIWTKLHNVASNTFGQLIFELKGKKLKGTYCLIKLKPKLSKDKNWLFFKKKSK